MGTESIYAVIISVVTVLGSTGAWRYYEKRAELKRQNDNFLHFDCRDRISKLEALLEDSSKEKEKMRTIILELTKSVSELSVKVEFLERENRRLLEANLDR
jgi:23S rRNA maturation-related 3'-5' exoribonuclease YhaM